MYIQSNVETFLPGSGEKCRSVFLGSAVEHFESSNKLIKKECKSTGPPAYSNTSESDTLHGYSDQWTGITINRGTNTRAAMY